FTHLDARAYLQILDALARQLAVTGKSPHPVIDVTIARCVGVALVDQGLDHAEHAVDMFAGPRLLIRTQHAQAALVLVHGGDHALGQLLEAFAILGSTADDLVVDVGDVAYVGQVVTTVAQPAGYHIEGHHDPGMADMTEVIHGHAADVHAHLVVHKRTQRLLGLAQGVIDLQGHAHCPQESRRVTVRLNTRSPGRECLLSAQKWPSRSNWKRSSGVALASVGSARQPVSTTSESGLILSRKLPPSSVLSGLDSVNRRSYRRTSHSTLSAPGTQWITPLTLRPSGFLPRVSGS